MKCIGATVTALMIVAVSACGAHGTKPTSSPTSERPPHPHFDVVLDDGGLRLPRGPTPAGMYRVSFEDRRSHKSAGEHVWLWFRPSGPRIVLFEVPAGTTTLGTLLQGEETYVTVDFVERSFPVQNPLSVYATPQYSTPVT